MASKPKKIILPQVTPKPAEAVPQKDSTPPKKKPARGRYTIER